MSCMERHMPQPKVLYVHARSSLAGSPASAAELSKSAKFADIIAGVDFVPSVIETSGVWGERVLILEKEVGRRMAEVSE